MEEDMTGMVLAGKYRLNGVLGRGGMGVVYAAWDLRLRKEWAVKVIPKSSARRVSKNADSRQVSSQNRLLRAEVEALTHLDHPGLPRIVDVTENDQAVCLVMDLVKGRTLEEEIRISGRHTAAAVTDWLLQLADLLTYLHGQSPPLIYRDLKPANVMLCPDGRLKLVDLGALYRCGKSGFAAFAPEDQNHFPGTRGFTAPELLRGVRPTPASDIYSLGVTGFCLLEGMLRPAIGAEEMNGQVETAEEGLRRILGRCCRERPGQRYPDCLELRRDLEALTQAEEAQKRAEMRHIRPRLRAFRRYVLEVSAAIVVLALAGNTAVCQAEAGRQKEYEGLLSAAGDPSVREEDYLRMIAQLDSSRTEAYFLLLDCWETKGFSTEESSLFESLLREHQQELAGKEEYGELMYQTGIANFFYLAGEDVSFRVRVEKARRYFELAAGLGDSAYPWYTAACRYRLLTDLYLRSYLPETETREMQVGIPDPAEKGRMEKILDALRGAEKDLMEEREQDYVRLVFLREFGQMVYFYREDFAGCGISQDGVLEFMDRISEDLAGLKLGSGEQRECLQVMEDIAAFSDEIRQSYDMAVWQ